MYTIGIAALAACGSVSSPLPKDHTPIDVNRPDIAEDQIAHDLERLEALDVVAVEGLIAQSPSHKWSPYAGSWIENADKLFREEQAKRLKHLVDVSSTAVAQLDQESALEQISDLLIPLSADDGPQIFCVTHSEHEANLEHLKSLEIVAFEDLVKNEAAAQNANCYAGFFEVTEQSAMRALKLEAIVEATSDFYSVDFPDADERP